MAGVGAFIGMFGAEFLYRLACAPYRSAAEDNDRLLQQVAALEDRLDTHESVQAMRERLATLVGVYNIYAGHPARPITDGYSFAHLKADFAAFVWAVDPFLVDQIEKDEFARLVIVPKGGPFFQDSLNTEHDEFRYVFRQRLRRLRKLLAKLQRRIERTA